MVRTGHVPGRRRGAMIPGAMPLVPARVTAFFALPVLRRAAFHLRRMTGGLDRAFFVRISVFLAGILLLAALAVTFSEGYEDDDGKKTLGSFLHKFFLSVHWAVTTVMAAGDASFVQSPIGILVSWLLVLFGVGIVAALTGALVGFLIDYL